jgi:tellurite resistance protein TehA-like permease
VAAISRLKGGSATSDIREKNQLAPALRGLGKRYARPTRLRIPPNWFGIPLGLAGLATAWHAAGAKLGVTPAIADGIYILAAVVLLIVGWLYAAQGPRRVLADLRDPVMAPFVAVPGITAMMLAAALASVAFAAGRVLVVIFLAITIGFAGWLGGTGYAVAAITAITVFIAAIAVRTAIALAHGQFLAQPAERPPSPRPPVPG